MTVGELIAKLEEYSKDYRVIDLYDNSLVSVEIDTDEPAVIILEFDSDD